MSEQLQLHLSQQFYLTDTPISTHPPLLPSRTEAYPAFILPATIPDSHTAHEHATPRYIASPNGDATFASLSLDSDTTDLEILVVLESCGLSANGLIEDFSNLPIRPTQVTAHLSSEIPGAVELAPVG